MLQAFEALKSKIRAENLLSFPDYGDGHKPLELYVEASASEAGACLAQRQGR